MQKVLWDRRLSLRVLEKVNVPTPQRIEVNRDGGPRLPSPELAKHVKKISGVVLQGAEDGTGGGEPLTRMVEMADDNDTLVVDGQRFRKPCVLFAASFPCPGSTVLAFYFADPHILWYKG
jgi:inositol-hexakisphosphate/diphosphoinositol-pentakisphosphate 1-kinase